MLEMNVDHASNEKLDMDEEKREDGVQTSSGFSKNVTMDNSYGIGYRSPCVSLQQYQGPISPVGHGRSVREFEEQMATLRKENFNLKLRLYFIEESIPGYHQACDGQDTIMKQLIDSKVEMEMLRKEIQEKQDILKEAAQAMNQMESIQKESENKNQILIDELKQKVQSFEMDRDMGKSQNIECMSDILGHAQLTENIDALQKIRELEGIIKQSDEKISQMQNQIINFNESLHKRNETIKEYEDKVKELVFQNAELLETLENKQKNMTYAERTIQGLRIANFDLKGDNENLVKLLHTIEQNYHNELSNIKLCEQQIRYQQDALRKMQFTIASKTENTTRLLDRLHEYENMVTQINSERNTANRENHFFRTIIAKLYERTDSIEEDKNVNCIDGNQDKCYRIEKSLYHEVNTNKIVGSDDKYESASILELSARGDYNKEEHKYEENCCVNVNNHKLQTQINTTTSSIRDGDLIEWHQPIEYYYLRHSNNKDQDICGCDLGCINSGPDIPIRYTISDVSLLDSQSLSKSNSFSSVYANYSSSSLLQDKDNDRYEILKHKFRPFLLGNNQELRSELQDRKTMLADKICQLEEAEEKLKSRKQNYEQACRTIQKLMLKIKIQQDEINRFQIEESVKRNNFDERNSYVQGIGLRRSFSDSVILHKLSGTQQYNYETIIQEQKTIIKILRADIEKKTLNLQNLVNTELWGKNREIERLTKVLSDLCPSNSPSQKAITEGNCMRELQPSLTDTEFTKVLERNKMLEQKINLLLRLKENESNEEELKLRSELCKVRADAEKAEKWRNECADVCRVLSDRLEELASFLNSLLKHKEILDALAVDKRHAMQNAIDSSLNLSKNLNRTLSISSTPFLNQSAHLIDLSHFLCNIGGRDDCTLNSQNEINSSVHLVTTNCPTNECNDRKKECLTLSTALDASESEWSEPDRKVSLARIGLEECCNHLESTKDINQLVLESDSENSNVKVQVLKTVSSQSPKQRVQERLTRLEETVLLRDDKIQKLSAELIEANNLLQRERLRIHGMEKLHKNIVQMGEKDYEQELKSCTERNQLLQQQVNEQMIAIKQLQDERNLLLLEVRHCEFLRNTLQKDMDEMKVEHENAIKKAVENESQRFKGLKEELEVKTQQKLEEKERLHQKALSRDWVMRSLHEDTKKQLYELQKQFTDAQSCIDNLNDVEKEIKRTLVENELTIRELKKQLDECTLQASKVVLERTKAFNDKIQLEYTVQELTKQLAARQKEFNTMPAHYSEQTVCNYIPITDNRNISDIAESAGYTTEEAKQNNVAIKLNANISKSITSPDIGTERGSGRLSCVEISNAQHLLLQTVELKSSNDSVNDHAATNFNPGSIKINCNQTMIDADEKPRSSHITHDCVRIEQENAELRSKLMRTKQAFEDTYEKLRLANQRKAQIEKDIKNQILKTHNVLKNVRTNMENEM